MPSDDKVGGSNAMIPELHTSASSMDVLQVILFAPSELIPMYKEAAESQPITLHTVSTLNDLREETDRMADVSPVLFIFDLVLCNANAVLQSMISITKNHAKTRTHVRIGVVPSTRSRPFHNADLHYLVKRESATKERLQEALTTCIKAASSANFEIFDAYHKGQKLRSEQVHIPNYLRNVPEIVRTTFQKDAWRLSSRSHGFRELVKDYCHLPAYFGVVLFKRIKQYSRIARQLRRENVLEPVQAYFTPGEDGNRNADNSAESEYIELRDFLRFCTEDFCGASATTKFLKLIHEPEKDEIVSLETDQEGASSSFSGSHEWRNEKIEKRRLKPFVEALIERHPDLASLRTNSSKRKAYVKYVLESILSSLEGVSAKSTTVQRLFQSNMVNIFYKCAVNRLCQLPTFDIMRFEAIFAVFCDALVPENNNRSRQKIMTTESLRAVEKINIHPQILDAVLPLSANGGGFDKFLLLFLAQEDGMSSKSLGYWFRLLDYDQDGYLCSSDLECIYRKKLSQAEIPCSEEIIDKIMLITLDMAKPTSVTCNGDFKISPLDIRRTGSGCLLHDIFIKSSVSDIEARAHEYAGAQQSPFQDVPLRLAI